MTGLDLLRMMHVSSLLPGLKLPILSSYKYLQEFILYSTKFPYLKIESTCFGGETALIS